MNVFDTHCHLYDERFDEDREQAYARMLAAGVKRCVCVGCDVPTSRLSIDFAQAHPGVWASAGVHPQEAKDAGPGYLDDLRGMLRQDRVVALGEIGLDYYYELSPRDVQKRVMAEQIDLALEMDVPVIFHVRDAHGDMVEHLRSRSRLPAGIMHCFSGSWEMAQELYKMGWYIGVDGPLTYKNAAKLPEIVEKFPLERILVETDAPYLAPVPMRGKQNEPAFVRYVAEKVAEIKGISVENVAKQTSESAEELYGI